MSTVRVFPFSVFDPVHLGIDENGEHVHVNLAERNILVGGEPGAGKSSALNLITAHGAMSCDCKLVLIDGKLVELGAWRHCADMFIGPSMTDALAALTTLQQVMNTRYDTLLATGRRKITQDCGEPVYLVLIDEYAYFSATVGELKEQKQFGALSRDLVARGVGWLLAETGVPRRIKTAYLTDTDITDLAAYAAHLRGHPVAA